MNELTEIKQKVDGFFDKKQISAESRYFICKALQEEYWDYIQNENEEEPEEEEAADEFEDLDNNNDVIDTDLTQDNNNFDDLDLEPPKPLEEPIAPIPKPKLMDHKNKIQSILKKPKIGLK